jgi:broad specificity phosphatase PhoE
VATSPRPRAVETAEAMGFPVSETLPWLAEMPDDVGISVDELLPRSFADYAKLAERSESMGDYARSMAERCRKELMGLPDGSRLLLISHGGIIEFSAVAALPDQANDWGPLVGYLEGFRLELEDGRWTRGDVLRVPT